MYRVPPSRRQLSDVWAPVPRFIVQSSFIIACLSALLMTGTYMWRHKDFFALDNVGIFIVIAIYFCLLGYIFSGFVHAGAFLLLAPWKRPIPQWIRTVVYSVVALGAIAIIVRVNPYPGEETDARFRFIGLVVTPCIFHVVAILWFDYRGNRARPIERASTDVEEM